MQKRVRLVIVQGVSRDDIFKFSDNVIGLKGNVSISTTMHNKQLLLHLQLFERSDEIAAKEAIQILISVLYLQGFLQNHDFDLS
ncbi:hypothetical protein [Acinetobacter tibetensis]|uniref:Uncharacterized protein n=1 Tax=Acinetobacter tibetensis TaxID=2943497 RepID=A0AAE9LP42_9GAMM|nr:hypothetical protein [Acinetobacter tibetensis]USE82048.1 hypothetical protein M5E07_09465 [Acinetobacter tibetensis]